MSAICVCASSCADDAELSYPSSSIQQRPSDRYEMSSESDTVKVLFVGNSFARDVLDGYITQMLRTEGVPYIIGVLHYPACTVQQHLLNGLYDCPVYYYYERGNDINIYETEYTLDRALDSQLWNIVSFQQNSEQSGHYQTYVTSLDMLIDYVKYRTCHDTRRYFFQTWAYDSDFEGIAFDSYNRDQQLMYEMIAGTSQRIMSDYGFDKLVPGGTAIQNARTSILGPMMTLDGRHLSHEAGRFTVAAVWAEVLTGTDCRSHRYVTNKFPIAEQAVCREAAHSAIEHPYRVTEVSN